MPPLPDEKDTLKKDPTLENDELKVEFAQGEGDEAGVEIVDDTPPQDRNRKPLPPEDKEPTEEEMAEYSEAVKKRIGKEIHRAHDERRAKEVAIRERDELAAAAKKLLEEKKALEARYMQGEDAFLAQTKEKVDLTMAQAKRAYKEAYEVGDAEKMADAQEQIAKAAADAKRTEDWASQAAQRKEAARQTKEPVVQTTQPSQTQAPEPDPDAVDWASKNKWFGENKRMTATAYGIHDELISEGVDPKEDSAEYYKQLNTRMREVFPAYEWGDKPRKTPPSTVAPVSRTSKTAQRVVLTQSQVAVARRLGLTPLQYATELAKLEKA